MCTYAMILQVCPLVDEVYRRYDTAGMSSCPLWWMKCTDTMTTAGMSSCPLVDEVYSNYDNCRYVLLSSGG